MQERESCATGRPTIHDLARAAGVSVSTIDRVLNGRNPVRQITADRVLEAAERIGFRGLAAIRHRVANSRPVGRLGFLLQHPEQKEYRLWGELLAEATRSSTIIHGRPVVRFLKDLTPESVVENLMALSREVDAVALVAADHPKVNHAVAILAGDGLPVFTLISNLSSRSITAFVGIDDLKKGRTAGWFVNSIACQAASVAVIMGNARYLSQDLAEAGFRSYLRQNVPQARIVHTEPTLEHDEQAFAITEKLLREEPSLCAIYVAGGGIGGVISALRAHNDRPMRPFTIVNELTDETRAALAEGVIDVVLSHPAKQMALTVTQAMARSLLGNTDPGSAQHLLPFEIFTSENI